MRSYKTALVDNDWTMYFSTVPLPLELWSDASLRGWSYLLAYKDAILGGIWGNVQFDERIDLIELRTAVWQITRVATAVSINTTIIVWCDNVVACAALRRKRGWSWASNVVLLPLGDLLLSKNCVLDVRWVETAAMKADAWTRLRLPDGISSKEIGPQLHANLMDDIHHGVIVLSPNS